MDLVPVIGAAIVAVGAALLLKRRRQHAVTEVALRDLDFVAIDTETTGLDPRRDAIVALAAVPFAAGQPCPEQGYTSLVNPGRPIPLTAQAIHGIADADVGGAPSLAAALPPFFAVCRDRVLVGHSIAFDRALINRAAGDAGLAPLIETGLDIGALAHEIFPSWWDLSLDGLCRLTEIVPIDRHTALGDALSAGAVFLRLVPLLERRGVRTLDQAVRLQRRTATVIPVGPGAAGGGLAGP